ncbi:MAG TPA: redoxin domain-containing protein [Bacillales bacterium]|nr:redoxin domain-containing protein [Bacillales bacterium]
MGQLRQNAKKYEELGVSILVIAGQKRENVKQWLEQNPMPFPFLIDEDRAVIKSFDVYHPIGLDAFNIAHPSLFLISAEQTISFAYVGKNQFDRPSDDLTNQKVHELLSKTID